MPDQRGRKTPQESLFVQAMAATNDAVFSAREAQYAHPAQRAHDLMKRPAIVAEVLQLQQERLFNEILPLAVEVHKALLLNPATPAGAKVRAVELAYDRAFGAEGAASGKQPHEMTADELARELDRLKSEAAARARPVIEGTAETVEEPGVFA